MIVAVQKGLVNLKNYLTKNGFDTVYYGDYPYPIDAVVYKGISASLINGCHPHHGGKILLVDCSSKTPPEVAKILSSKLYTPLF